MMDEAWPRIDVKEHPHGTISIHVAGTLHDTIPASPTSHQQAITSIATLANKLSRTLTVHATTPHTTSLLEITPQGHVTTVHHEATPPPPAPITDTTPPQPAEHDTPAIPVEPVEHVLPVMPPVPGMPAQHALHVMPAQPAQQVEVEQVEVEREETLETRALEERLERPAFNETGETVETGESRETAETRGILSPVSESSALPQPDTLTPPAPVSAPSTPEPAPVSEVAPSPAPPLEPGLVVDSLCQATPSSVDETLEASTPTITHASATPREGLPDTTLSADTVSQASDSLYISAPTQPLEQPVLTQPVNTSPKPAPSNPAPELELVPEPDVEAALEAPVMHVDEGAQQETVSVFETETVPLEQASPETVPQDVPASDTLADASRVESFLEDEARENDSLTHDTPLSPDGGHVEAPVTPEMVPVVDEHSTPATPPAPAMPAEHVLPPVPVMPTQHALHVMPAQPAQQVEVEAEQAEPVKEETLETQALEETLETPAFNETGETVATRALDETGETGEHRPAQDGGEAAGVEPALEPEASILGEGSVSKPVDQLSALEAMLSPAPAPVSESAHVSDRVSVDEPEPAPVPSAVIDDFDKPYERVLKGARYVRRLGVAALIVLALVNTSVLGLFLYQQHGVLPGSGDQSVARLTRAPKDLKALLRERVEQVLKAQAEMKTAQAEDGKSEPEKTTATTKSEAGSSQEEGEVVQDVQPAPTTPPAPAPATPTPTPAPAPSPAPVSAGVTGLSTDVSTSGGGSAFVTVHVTGSGSVPVNVTVGGVSGSVVVNAPGSGSVSLQGVPAGVQSWSTSGGGLTNSGTVTVY